MIVADQYEYEVVQDYRNAFNEEEFKGRYADILSKYDYIVGDWGYGQLRLKGFYEDRNQKSTFDTKISTLDDYLYEYCNFGCAYFIARKIGKIEPPAPEEVTKESKEKKVTEPVQEKQPAQ